MNPFTKEQIQLILYLGILKCKPNFVDLTVPTKVKTVDEALDNAAIDYLWEVVRPFIRENVVSKYDFVESTKSILDAQDLTINDIVKQINRDREEIIRILRNNGIDL